jgi:hypothetical protein
MKAKTPEPPKSRTAPKGPSSKPTSGKAPNADRHNSAKGKSGQKKGA